MSFLAIPLYSKSFIGAFLDINKYIWKSHKKIDLKETFITILYRYLYEIVFIVILSYSMTDYASSLDVSFLQTIMTILCSVLISVFLFIIYQRHLMNGSLSEFLDKTPDDVVNRSSSEDVNNSSEDVNNSSFEGLRSGEKKLSFNEKVKENLFPIRNNIIDSMKDKIKSSLLRKFDKNAILKNLK